MTCIHIRNMHAAVSDLCFMPAVHTSACPWCLVCRRQRRGMLGKRSRCGAPCALRGPAPATPSCTACCGGWPILEHCDWKQTSVQSVPDDPVGPCLLGPAGCPPLDLADAYSVQPHPAMYGTVVSSAMVVESLVLMLLWPCPWCTPTMAVCCGALTCCAVLCCVVQVLAAWRRRPPGRAAPGAAGVCCRRPGGGPHCSAAAGGD